MAAGARPVAADGVYGVQDEIYGQLAEVLGVARHGQRLGRLAHRKLDARVQAGRPDQRANVVDQGRERNALAAGGPGPAQGQKTLHVGLHQAELPQGDLERLVAGRHAAFPLVQLDGHSPAGSGVAKLMGHARPQLPQRPKLLAAADLALVLA